MKPLRLATIFFIFLSPFVSAEQLKVKVSAKSAILINAKTGAILYEKLPYEKRAPGSITKLATLLYGLKENKEGFNTVVSCPYHCLKRINPTMKVANNYTDPSHWLETDGTMLGIRRGEKLTLQDLLYGMMLVSGNDAANFVAHHIGGTIPKFMQGMNEALVELGCKKTHFTNPHGLHHPDHLTTAYDMALITREVLKSEMARALISSQEHECGETNLQKVRTIKHNTNLLQPGRFFYSKAIGMKTGVHSKAGYTIAGGAEKGDRLLIAVLLGCPSSSDRARDTIRLFDTAFAEEEESRLLFKKDENFFTRKIKGSTSILRAVFLDDVIIHYFPSEEPHISIELNWEGLALPISVGDWVGEMHILDEKQNILEKASLFATRDVKKKRVVIFIDGLKMGSLDLNPFRGVLVIFLFIGVAVTFYFIFRLQD